MGFFRKTKGVISVFLILIMLPLFTSAVILVDGTRYQSAKTIAQEAGDMAAYSVLADYNTDLKDSYGLFAMDTSDVATTFKSYLNSSLGYSASGDESYSDKIQSLISSSIFGGGDYSDADFFNLYNFTVNDATTAEGIYPLSEPAVLQNQIVEYVKYRGVETLLERFQILANTSEAQSLMESNSHETDAMKEVSEADAALSGNVAAKLATLITKITDYKAALNTVYETTAAYNSTYQQELHYMGVNDSSTARSLKTQREAYKSTLFGSGDGSFSKLTEKYNEVLQLCNSVISAAQSAKSEYEQLKTKYGDTDTSKDIQEELSILEKLLGSDESYSVAVFKQKFTEADPTETINDLKSNITTANEKLNSSHSSYNSLYSSTLRELNSKKSDDDEEEMTAEEKEEYLNEHVRYHVYLKNGTEWYVTKDKTYLNRSADTALDTAAKSVAEDSYGLNLWQKRATYLQCPTLENYYKKYAEQQKDDNKSDKTDSVTDEDKKNAVSSANEKKNESTGTTQSEATISDSVYSGLPSQKAGKSASSESSEIADINEDDASDMISSSTSVNSSVMQFFESARNDVLVYCYILDTFKTRNSLTDYSSKEKNKWYSTTWRYSNSAGEVNLRDKAKKDLTTFFQSGEVEYIFGGHKSEKTNKSIVYAWIYATRLANNLVAVKNNSTAYAECTALAAASSLAVGGTIPMSVFRWVYIAAWAAGETALEMAYLIDDGYRVPLIKTKDNLYIDGFTKIAGAIADRENIIPRTGSSLNVCYEDYLAILMFFVDRETRLLRVADLVQLNMVKQGDSDFDISKCNTYIKATTDVSIKFMFQPISQFQSAYNGTGLRIKNEVYQGY